MGRSNADLREFVESWPEIPLVLCDRYLTVVASTELAQKLTPVFRAGANIARHTFLRVPDGLRSDSCESWSRQVAATLHESVERHRDDRRFEALIGELAALSPSFATAWASPVEVDRAGIVVLSTEIAGVMSLGYQQLRVPDEDDEMLLVWSAADESSRDALNLLRATSSRSG